MVPQIGVYKSEIEFCNMNLASQVALLLDEIAEPSNILAKACLDHCDVSLTDRNTQLCGIKCEQQASR